MAPVSLLLTGVAAIVANVLAAMDDGLLLDDRTVDFLATGGAGRRGESRERDREAERDGK
ncbi:hypothetical protein [Aurantimonas aggregata]|uniref:hypothetical protein n=1 Tax=Aurantimonas aggregata TaxID=2047720 RepID=UPI00194497CE|nr:hypothetical protein [Aurantimonas aggregata]